MPPTLCLSHATSLVDQTLENGLRVLEQIGSTGDGPLYRAEYPTGAEVALLVLGPDPHPRFRQAAGLRHVNLATVHEMVELPDGPAYVVLECPTGKLLSEILAERGALPPAEALDLFLQVAAGLEAAHEAGVTHANLSPDTVLITQPADEPLVKLIGFALVSSLPPALEKPMGQEVGAEYASPERLAGYVPDQRSDVYSLGALLHHLLAGAPPGFGSEGVASAAMRATVAKAVRPIPEHRFQTVSEFVRAVKLAAEVATGAGPAPAAIGSQAAIATWPGATVVTSPQATVATRPSNAVAAGASGAVAAWSRRVRVRRSLLLTAGSVVLVTAGLWLFTSLQARVQGVEGPAPEPGRMALASDTPDGGTETGSRLLASRSEGRGKAPAPRASSPAPAASEDSTEPAAPTGASKVGAKKPAAPRKTPAAAPPKVAEERRPSRAEVAARARKSKARSKATLPDSAPGYAPAEGEADTGAMSPPSPAAAGTSMEERAQIDSRIGLDEATRHLGGPAHAIEGMSPLFLGLARGRFPEGADPAAPLVRGVYLDPNGGLILLDQQRVRSEPRASTPGGNRWRIGNVMLFLHGDGQPSMLRNLAKRVR